AADLSVDRLKLLRQDNIVRDAERLREYLGIDKWSLFGQSFGGFCITSYVSLFPESVDKAFLTGGLRALLGRAWSGFAGS
ncbi:alpha/beta fold hydrolase, partial [Bacteroides fragilis]|nr:alpha/beta fold hydrolase [Bacteroides fragilis]